MGGSQETMVKVGGTANQISHAEDKKVKREKVIQLADQLKLCAIQEKD